jgi:ribose transport system permease protein
MRLPSAHREATGQASGKGVMVSGARISPRLSDFGVLIGLVVLFAAFSIASRSFLTFDNIITVIRQISMIAIIAVGETIVFIGGGIDASVGAVAGLGGILSILLASKGMNVELSILIGLLSGGVAGLLSGVIITKIGIMDFIVTLAMISIAHGTNFSITRAKSIYMNIPEAFTYLGKGYVGPIPVPIIIMVVIYGLSSFVIRNTKLGTYIFATGGNKVATRLSGINVDRIKITMYVISGVFAS